MKSAHVAILDDYQRVALSCADWSAVEALAEITIFADHVTDEDELVQRLAPFEIICVMRERTLLPGSLLERLPRLRLIASTGPVNAAIDTAAAQRLGIDVMHTGYSLQATIELTWALILASQRHLLSEATSLRSGGWQRHLGRELRGRTLGILGLGRIGGAVARIGQAFGMKLVAWSANLTHEQARDAGATLVDKQTLFAESDVLTIHTLLSRRTRGLVDTAMLGLMKTDAWLINTSRGPIVDEAAMIAALSAEVVGGYAVDVYADEPLPDDHPFRSLRNVLATPHIGYVAADLYRTFYGDCARDIAAFLGGDPTFTP